MMRVEEKRKHKFKGKNILVVGLARSGTGAANLLAELGARVTITDKKPLSLLEDQMKQLLPAVKFVEEDRAGEMIDSLDLIVISPGVPLYIPFLVKASIKGIPVIGELELAYQVLTSAVGAQQSGSGGALARPVSPRPAIIGITGTNGKSTTTTLVDLMLKEAGYKTLLAGNIGNALTEELFRTLSTEERPADSKIMAPYIGPRRQAPDFIVVEISSFQLETIEEFRPDVAAILNITPDHLDRYDSMRDYADAKFRIAENQTADDFLALNADDPEIEKVEREKLNMKSEKPSLLYFSMTKEVDGIYFKDGVVHYDFRNIDPGKGIPQYAPAKAELLRADEIRIRGAHNVENAMAASLMAMVSGCGPDAVRNVLTTFPGLEHRVEFVDDVKGVKFINDSKGTNVGAVAKSLADYENIILIMGGLDKGSDFSVLADLIKTKVKLLILIGKAADAIAEALGSAAETQRVSGLGEAVALSMTRASSGDIVMLSPGCASFDMFRDFEDRGRKFKEAVRAYKKEIAGKRK